MLKGLSEQVANVRYNTFTSALDAVNPPAYAAPAALGAGRLHFRVYCDAFAELDVEPVSAAADRYRLTPAHDLATSAGAAGRRCMRRSGRVCGAAAAGVRKHSITPLHGRSAAAVVFQCRRAGRVSQRNSGTLSAAEPAQSAAPAGAQQKRRQFVDFSVQRPYNQNRI